MTAVPNLDTVDPRDTDADLVRGSLAGDRAAFAAIYDRYADRLYDFCVGMLRDYDAAADCVQETFCVAATRLPQLRDPDKLRPWLYSIARNEALGRLRELRREAPSEELPDVQSEDAGPDTLAARTELADLIAEAAGGLTDRDRAVFDLAFRQGLDGPELAEALGVSHTNANTLVHRLRQTVERSLGALLVCRGRRASGGCDELGQILAGWNGQFSVLMRKRVARHIESCQECDDERRRLVSPSALLAAAPAFIPAPKWLRDKTINDIQLVCHTSAIAGQSGIDDSDAGASETDDRRRRLLLAAVLVVVLGAATALLLAWLNGKPVSVLPTEITENPTTTQATVPAVAPPSQTTAPAPPPPPVAPMSPSDAPVLIPTEPPPSASESPPQVAPSSQGRPTPVTRSPSSYAPTATASNPAPPSGGGGGSGNRGTAP
ncbi:sigma-70 family RNA polymerase sigma factor [Mycobacterium sp. OAE908]|uniref:sigma-70 family RNA polymerase sigma factor n=1 Tax=Mycobacterium sp. OAE908 TaxID=2817899 RepID=UPI001AEA97EA